MVFELLSFYQTGQQFLKDPNLQNLELLMRCTLDVSEAHETAFDENKMLSTLKGKKAWADEKLSIEARRRYQWFLARVSEKVSPFACFALDLIRGVTPSPFPLKAYAGLVICWRMHSVDKDAIDFFEKRCAISEWKKEVRDLNNQDEHFLEPFWDGSKKLTDIELLVLYEIFDESRVERTFIFEEIIRLVLKTDNPPQQLLHFLKAKNHDVLSWFQSRTDFYSAVAAIPETGLTPVLFSECEEGWRKSFAIFNRLTQLHLYPNSNFAFPETEFAFKIWLTKKQFRLQKESFDLYFFLKVLFKFNALEELDNESFSQFQSFLAKGYLYQGTFYKLHDEDLDILCQALKMIAMEMIHKKSIHSNLSQYFVDVIFKSCIYQSFFEMLNPLLALSGPAYPSQEVFDAAYEWLAIKGKLDIVKLLLEVKTRKPSSKVMCSAIFFAIEKEHIEIVKTLLTASPKLSDIEGIQGELTGKILSEKQIQIFNMLHQYCRDFRKTQQEGKHKLFDRKESKSGATLGCTDLCNTM